MKLPAHSYAWYALAAVVVTSLLFCLTDATKVPSFVVIVAFLLVAASLWAVIFAALHFIALYGVRVAHKARLAGYITSFLGGVVALQSIGELSQRDVSVLLPLVLLGYLYTAYAKSSRRNLES